MKSKELEALCRPRLDTLWPDIRVPGQSVWNRDWNEGVVLAGCDTRVLVAYKPEGHEIVTVSFPAGLWRLDLLASPIGADLLARRVAVYGGILHGSVGWHHSDGRGSNPNCNIQVVVPTLGQLDPACTERVSWPNLGSARLVDLAALALVGQHLYQQEQSDAG